VATNITSDVELIKDRLPEIKKKTIPAVKNFMLTEAITPKKPQAAIKNMVLRSTLQI